MPKRCAKQNGPCKQKFKCLYSALSKWHLGSLAKRRRAHSLSDPATQSGHIVHKSANGKRQVSSKILIGSLAIREDYCVTGTDSASLPAAPASQFLQNLMLACSCLEGRVLDPMDNFVTVSTRPQVNCGVVANCSSLDLNAQDAEFRMSHHEVRFAINLPAIPCQPKPRARVEQKM